MPAKQRKEKTGKKKDYKGRLILPTSPGEKKSKVGRSSGWVEVGQRLRAGSPVPAVKEGAGYKKKGRLNQRGRKDTGQGWSLGDSGERC